MRRVLSVLGLVAVSCWSIAQAGEVSAPRVQEVQFKPVLGVHGPVSIDYVTGEITHGKKQTRQTVVYASDPNSIEVGLDPQSLDPWGDDLVCIAGGLLSTQSFSVFNTSDFDLNSVTLTVNLLDYNLVEFGDWVIDLDFIELIGGPLEPGFAVLIEVTGLDGENINVPRFVIPELVFSNPDDPDVNSIGQVSPCKSLVGWSASAFYSGGDWWVYSGQEAKADFYNEIGVASPAPSPALLYTTGGVTPVKFDGNNSLLGLISGYFDASLPQRWSAMAFKLANDSTIKQITAYWFTQDGAEGDIVRYRIWRRTGLTRPTPADEVAGHSPGTAGPFEFDGNGPSLWFRTYDVNIALPRGDYWLSIYADGGDTPNWLAWFVGGDKADEALERADGKWRTRMYPSPGFENWASTRVTPWGACGADPDDRWNTCFALWGDARRGCLPRGDCNEDGRIDLSDLAILLGCYGAGTCCDTNNSGNTDLSDLATLLANFNTNCP